MLKYKISMKWWLDVFSCDIAVPTSNFVQKRLLESFKRNFEKYCIKSKSLDRKSKSFGKLKTVIRSDKKSVWSLEMWKLLFIIWVARKLHCQEPGYARSFNLLLLVMSTQCISLILNFDKINFQFFVFNL